MIGIFFEDGEIAGGGFVAGLAAGDGAVDADFVADHEIDALAGDGDDDCDVGFIRCDGVEDTRSGPGRLLSVDEFFGGLHPGMGKPLGARGARAEGGDGQGGGEAIEGAPEKGGKAEELGIWVVQGAGKEHTLTGLWPRKHAVHAENRRPPTAGAGRAEWLRRALDLPRSFKCATYSH